MDLEDLAIQRAQGQKDLIDLHWYEGDLSFLLYEHQLEMVNHFYGHQARKEVWHCSRRLGKSAGALVIGLETGRRKKGAIIRYGAATQKDVKEIIHPLMRILTESCPEAIKPKWRQAEGKYYFPQTEAFMVVSGLDEGRADNLRGTSMDLGILDEGAFVDDLEYCIKGVLMPQLLTTDGRILIASTSPRSSDHPFVYYVREAEREGAYIRKTIFEDSRTEVLGRIPEWCKEAGGESSTTWRREYLCEIITDEERALIPEFSRPEIRNRVVQQIEIPPYLIPYTVIDLGYVDKTAAVFGYVDFMHAKKVILDELVLHRQDSKKIADAILAKEKQIWGSDEQGQVKRVPRRYADGQPLTIADFNNIHGLSCVGVAKDTLEAEVNQLRLDVMSSCLQIHPRCLQTIQQFQDGIWDKNHRQFERTPTHGHFDLIAAAMYYARHANLRENPYPQEYGFQLHTHVIHNENKDGYVEDALKKAFRLKD